MFEKITESINSLNVETISEERKAILQPLVDYIKSKKDTTKNISLNFICTHNSRRSHLSQIWAKTIAQTFNINIDSYSGGTEATQLNANAKKALETSGFKFQVLAESENPIYAIKYSDNSNPIIGYSKTYDDPFNPSSQFGAIMTCSSADAGCPFIAGAEKRIPITFEDPKEFDGTDKQDEKYLERSIQIATELKYVFSNI